MKQLNHTIIYAHFVQVLKIKTETGYSLFLNSPYMANPVLSDVEMRSISNVSFIGISIVSFVSANAFSVHFLQAAL